MSAGERSYFAGFVDGEARALGPTLEDLEAWRPPKKTRARRAGAPKRRASPLDPEALLRAVTELQDPDGATQQALAEALGASSQKIGKTAQPLLEAGRLTLVSKRPKRFRVTGGA